MTKEVFYKGIYAHSTLEVSGKATIITNGGNSVLNRGGFGIFSASDGLNTGTSDSDFSGTLTVIAGTSGSGTVYAFNYNTTTNFEAEINYYTSPDGTSWAFENVATNFPEPHNNIFGLHFGILAPTITP